MPNGQGEKSTMAGIVELYNEVVKGNKEIRIEGDLDLMNTDVTVLPDNLKVGGSLYLSNTRVTALPDNLEVGEGLYLSGTGVTTLPDNLKVGGDLFLKNTGVTALPDNLKVGGNVVGLEENRKRLRKTAVPTVHPAP